MKSINLWKHFEEENNFIEIDEEAAQIRSNFFYTEVHITFYLGSKSERMEKKVSSIWQLPNMVIGSLIRMSIRNKNEKIFGPKPKENSNIECVIKTV